MKFQDIPTDILTVRVRRADNDTPLEEQAVLSVHAAPFRADGFDLRLDNAMVSVLPVAAQDIRRLHADLASGRAMLARLANRAADGSAELQIAFFTGECLEMGAIDIGVDEYMEAALTKIVPRNEKLKGDRLYRLLEERCCFKQGERSFFFLTAGAAIEEALAPYPADADEFAQGDAAATSAAGANHAHKTAPTRDNSLCIAGQGLRFVATETSLPQSTSIFLATRLTDQRRRPDRALRVASGLLRFADWTRAGKIQTLAQAQMRALTRDDGSYLKKWDEFGDLEGELLLAQARQVGFLQFFDMAQKRDGTVSVRLSQASDTAIAALTNGQVQELEIVDALPDYLTDPALTFKAFASAMEQAAESIDRGSKRQQREQKTYFAVTNFDSETMVVTLKSEALPATSGLLIRSLAGEIAQVKRRMAARKAIIEGRAANPQLGPLIEEKGQISPTRSLPTIAPLTAFVRDKVFDNPPTAMQEKAIEVALNTPDIAVIQGPPGTGKTTVIAAILERLNEMADKRGVRVKGQVLLTGFQHDAVENMIERLSLNSIPVPKFGKRANAEEDDVTVFDKRLEEWCADIAQALRARNPQIAEVERETAIRNLCMQYVQAPTRALAALLSAAIASLGIAVLGEHHTRHAAQLATKLSQREKLNDHVDQRLNAVRRLRISPESFADDGAERATDALDELDEVLERGDRALLDTASLWRHADGPPAFLDQLATLKYSLLSRFTAPPHFCVEKHNDEVRALAEIAVERLKVAGHSSRDVRSAALAEFLAELDNNPSGMINAVSDYSFAFAATCQQSVNRNMQSKKGLTKGNIDDNQKGMEYEYVIVDEAARVSPRDLMVPMAQGKRIILVGDHRQLPHIIDEEVARQMEEGETGVSESDWLKKSMFQYLFSERLAALEQNDGRPRRVTLDKQFRMHPSLGDFISRNFYERFDPLEKFASGKAAKHFAHALAGMEGRPAGWLQVPVEKGRHLRSGTSWTRPAEASVIARQLTTWMASEAGSKLSFGVISFYKAQAELIKKQLGALTDDPRRLRIGTVDSFQGMEFDVVLLSMVRTMPALWKPNDPYRERQAKTLFGHLCLYNRLNVSMSRQKKLLVVVGDAGLLQGGLAAEFVPGLVDFHRLCREEGVVLPC